MNSFQSISSGQGLLKDYYETGEKKDATSEVLARRRKKRMDLRNVPIETQDWDKPITKKP